MSKSKRIAPPPPQPEPPQPEPPVQLPPPQGVEATEGSHRLVVVGAKVEPEVKRGFDELARRLRGQNPSEPENRSLAIRTSFHIADTVLRGDRLRALNNLGGPLVEAVDRVMEAGFKALAATKS